MNAVLLDTHALLWWLIDDPALSAAARAAIADPTRRALVSTASVWEIAVKRSLGKLTVPDDLLAIVADRGFEWLLVSPQHAWDVHALELHHRDPFDRLLIAQARREGVPVVTADPRFRAYDVAICW